VLGLGRLPRQDGGIALQRAQALVATNLVGSGGRDAGEIQNLLVDRSGQVRAAVVEWGGLLGIGRAGRWCRWSRSSLAPRESGRG
jgi:hypothetical protein